MEGNTFKIGFKIAKGRVLSSNGGGKQTERTEQRGTKKLERCGRKDLFFRERLHKSLSILSFICLPFLVMAAKVGECSKQDIHFILRLPGHSSELEGSVAAKGNTLHTLLLWGDRRGVFLTFP